MGQGKLATQKGLPRVQIAAGALLIGIAILNLSRNRRHLHGDAAGLDVTFSRFRRRRLAWNAVRSVAIEGTRVRIEPSSSPPFVLEAAAPLDAAVTAWLRDAASRFADPGDVPGPS